MNPTFLSRVRALDSSYWLQLLPGIKRGFEKECLRVDSKGNLAQTPHPKALGSSLTHPMIITDYSEALLEFVTPPTDNLEEPITLLNDIQHYTSLVLAQAMNAKGENSKSIEELKSEILWVASMPCYLPKENQIPIAEYGHSNVGQLKHIYRHGLGYRYGRCMQTIAGIHYNFSLSDAFWQAYQTQFPALAVLSPLNFVSEQYLSMLRNARRWSWILPFLFGASPAVCASFFNNKKVDLETFGTDTFIGQYATSLRLSDLGYNSKIQARAEISYNSLDEFIRTMHNAVHTKAPEYQKIGVYENGEYRQLNDNILQIEDEHYAMFRPKRVAGRNERTLAAIMRAGIEYVEVRALDLNPYINEGVEPETVYFLDTFLLSCLLLDSPPLEDAENQRIGYNLSQIVRYGRQPGLELRDEQETLRKVSDWGIEIIDQMLEVAQLLDKAYSCQKFTLACKKARENFLNIERLPSAQILKEMTTKQSSHFEFAWHWSQYHQQQYLTKPFPAHKLEYFRELALESLKEKSALEQSDTLSFKDYLAQYLEV